MPVLTIIAGPNGAGKSTHSKELVADFGIEAFDFDKEFHAIWSQFNFDPYIEQGALERAQNSWTDKKLVALKEKQNFALETTYDTDQILAGVEMFRSARYHIELVFICLESPGFAVERVKDRVAKGGHAVDEPAIRERFSNGLRVLDRSFQQFDLVSIYLSKQNDMEAVALIEPRRAKAISICPFPDELIPHLPIIAGFVEENK